MNREYHRRHSPALGRDLEMLVFGHAGARVLVFPARCGRFYDYENWGLVDALAPKIGAGLIQLFCIDGVDDEALYASWRRPADRVRRWRDYERYVLEEAVPFTADRNPDYSLILHGCSLGAYHALTIALRNPEQFGKVVAVSGRYDLARKIGHYPDVFDGHMDTEVYLAQPSRFLPNLSDPSILSKMRHLDVTLAIGRDDVVAPDNRHVARTLRAKGVAAALYEWPGDAHRPRFWRQMLPHYL